VSHVRLNNYGKIYISMLIAALAAGCIYLWISRDSQRSNKHAEKAKQQAVVSIDIKEMPSPADMHWKTFLDSLKRNCEKEGNVSIDYVSAYRVRKNDFRSIVIAWKDSEYEIDLYRYNAALSGWEPASMHEVDGMEVVDVAVTARKWKIPESVIQSWIDEARKYMSNKYSSQ